MVFDGDGPWAYSRCGGDLEPVLVGQVPGAEPLPHPLATCVPPFPLQEWERRELAVEIAARMYPEVQEVIARGIARQAALLLMQPDDVLARSLQQLMEMAL